MWANTKPTRTMPVSAITTFLPMVEPKKVATLCISSPGASIL